jgi:hypothetical protein
MVKCGILGMIGETEIQRDREKEEERDREIILHFTPLLHTSHDPYQ